MREHKNLMHSPETITSGTGLFKAVCHKCHYVGFEPNHNRCVQCGFPLILEPYESAQVALRELFDRSSVELGIHVKAPPLPGVDPQKRKAQLLAEARRRLRAQSVAPQPAVARPATAQPVATRPMTQPVATRPMTRPVATRPMTHQPMDARPMTQPPVSVSQRPGTYQTRPIRRSKGTRVGVALAFVSAVVAGVALAVMTSGM